MASRCFGVMQTKARWDCCEWLHSTDAFPGML